MDAPLTSCQGKVDDPSLAWFVLPSTLLVSLILCFFDSALFSLLHQEEQTHLRCEQKRVRIKVFQGVIALHRWQSFACLWHGSLGVTQVAFSTLCICEP